MNGIYRTILALAATLPASVAAQHPLVLERLRNWDTAVPAPKTEVAAAEVTKAAAAIQKRGGGCLATSTIVESITSATGVRFVLQSVIAGQIKNAWTIVARHPNCGEVVRYTMVQDNGDNFSVIRTNRGRSHANESLIGDTFPLAALQAAATLNRAGTRCDPQSATLGVTRITKEEPDLGPETYGVRYSGSWSEAWPVALCGRTIEVGIRFTADGDGGAYQDLKGIEAKLLPPN